MRGKEEEPSRLIKKTVWVDVVSTASEFRSSGKIIRALRRQKPWVSIGEMYEQSIETRRVKTPKAKFFTCIITGVIASTGRGPRVAFGTCR